MTDSKDEMVLSAIRVGSRCQTSDCLCNRHDSAPVNDELPPFHDGCDCYIDATKRTNPYYPGTFSHSIEELRNAILDLGVAIREVIPWKKRRGQ